MPSRQSSRIEADRNEVLALVKAVPRAIDHKDVKSILAIYDTDNPRFTTFEDDPEYLERVDGVAFKRFIEGIGKLQSSSIQRKDVRADILSDSVALVTGIDDWSSKRDNKVTKGRSRFTIVFQKIGGKWKVVHEHFTKIS